MGDPITHTPEVAGSLFERALSEIGRRKEAKPETLEKFRDNPLGFVMWNWRWGLPGPLERFQGPDLWQKEFLIDLGEQVRRRAFNGRDAVEPIRMTVSAGQGPGKGALMSWLVSWIMSTRPYAQGTVTANTFTQLETKTWAAIEHWFKTGRTNKDFIVGSNGIKHRQHQKSWMCTPQTCKEENSESFAGQHAATSTSFYCNDEASAIPEKIWQVEEGGLSDGEPMLFAFGNATRSSGKFYRINFGDEMHRWNHRVIDSRDCMMPNKKLIQEWIDDYGEDSDFVRVRVKGLPPRAGDMQYIPSDSVYAAQKRIVEVLSDEPLIAGVDLARGGGDNAVVRFRRGDDARSIPAVVIPGELVRDSSLLVAKLADMATQTYAGVKVHTWFLDGGGIGGPIIDRLVQLGHRNMIEVQFGGQCPDPRHFANMRSWMWSRMRDALGKRLAIDKDRRLEMDLTNQGLAIGAGANIDRLVLESKESMKKRGLDSPDQADALCVVAGTLIQTVRGPIPIEKIQPGDMVVTPFGPSPVEVKYRSFTERLTSVKFSNGAQLSGKGEHQVFTFSSGSTRLDALSLTNEVDSLSRWRLSLWRSVSLLFTGDRSFGFKQLVDIFSQEGRMTRKDCCIAGFTWIISDLYRKVMMFTTKIRTGAITSPGILRLRSPLTTIGSTCSSDYPIPLPSRRIRNTWNELESLRPSGMGLQKGSSGTKSMGRKHGWTDFLLRRFALSAASNIGHTFLLGLGFAPARACRLSRSERTSRILGSVLSAVRNSWLIVTGRRPVVPLSVVTESVPPTETFNLTLREHNAYYANGILVFNCLTWAHPVEMPKAYRDRSKDFFVSDQEGNCGWMA